MVLVGLTALVLIFGLSFVFFRPRLTPFKEGFLNTVIQALLSAPMVPLFGVSATAVFTTYIFAEYSAHSLLPGIGTALVFGISLAFGLHLLSERPLWKIPQGALSLMLVAGAYFLTDSLKGDVFLFRWFQLFVLSHLFVSCCYILKNYSEDRFWLVNRNLLIAFYLSGCYSAFICAGIATATGLVQYLFEIREDNFFKVYPSFFAFCSLTIHPVLFLSIENQLRNKKEETSPDGLLISSLLSIGVKIIIVYMAILYLYAGKIALVRELPKGMVAWLVCSLGCAGIITWLFLNPLKKSGGVVGAFLNNFYTAFLPLLLLLYIGVYERISTYGLTEHRYVLLVLTLWISGITLKFILQPQTTIKLIPASLFICLAFTVYGPFSAEHISFNSQKKRLTRILFEQAGCESDYSRLKKGEIDNVSSILRYLIEVNPNGTLSLLGEICKSNKEVAAVVDNFRRENDHTFNLDRSNFPTEFLKALGIDPFIEPVYPANSFTFRPDISGMEGQSAIDIQGMEFLIENTYLYPSVAGEQSRLIDGLVAKLTTRGSDLIVKMGEREYKMDLTPLLTGLKKKPRNNQLNLSRKELTTDFEFDDRRFRLYIQSITGVFKDAIPVIQHMHLTIATSKKS